MKKTLATLAAVGLATAGIAGASASGQHKDPIGTVNFTITEHVKHQSLVNTKGPIGDVYIFGSILTFQGQAVGHAHGVCTSTSRTTSNCDVAAVFDAPMMAKVGLKAAGDTELTVAGEAGSDDSDLTLAVTGGTNGLYGFTGQVTVHPINAHKDRLFFDLLPALLT